MKTSDLNCVKYIKNENQRVSLRKMRLKKRWKIYFGKLIYETHTRYWSELSNPLEDRNRGLVINQDDLGKGCFKRMKIVKVMGLDEIPIEVWKYLDDVGVAWLTNLFSKILSVNKMSSELRRITLILICKNKGDVQNYKSLWN